MTGGGVLGKFIYLDALSLDTDKSHVYYAAQFSLMHNSLLFLQTLSKVEYSHTAVCA